MTPEDLKRELVIALVSAGWGRAVERGDELDSLVARIERPLGRPPGAERDVQEAMRRVAGAVARLADVVLDESEEIARTLASRLGGPQDPRLGVRVARVLLPAVVRAAVATSITVAARELHVVGRAATTTASARQGAARRR